MLFSSIALFFVWWRSVVGGVFVLFTITFVNFTSYIRDGRIVAIAIAGPLNLRHTKRVVRIPVDSIITGLGLTSATRVIILSVSKRRIPCRIACSRGIIFPIAIGTGNATACAVRPNAPRPFGMVTYNGCCSRHLSSIT